MLVGEEPESRSAMGPGRADSPSGARLGHTPRDTPVLRRTLYDCEPALAAYVRVRGRVVATAEAWV